MPEKFADKISVGITGGIGAGKSVVSRILRCNGYQVYDCDLEAKVLMNKDDVLKKALRVRVDPKIYNENGCVDKKYLSENLFLNADLRKKVNSLVHKAVREDIKKKNHGGILFIESAILATGQLIPLCDYIWIIESPVHLRLKRAVQRDCTTPEHIKMRMETQKKEFERIPTEKLVYLYNDDMHSLLLQIACQLERIKTHQCV